MMLEIDAIRERAEGRTKFARSYGFGDDGTPEHKDIVTLLAAIAALRARAEQAELISAARLNELTYERCEVERLRSENGFLRTAFRVNMLRMDPSLSHADIDKVIEAAASGDEQSPTPAGKAE